MPNHPLAEIFGFPANNLSREAQRYRRSRLCPFNNSVPNCTKDKAADPLGVCSILDDDEVVITCPIRFRQDWIVAEDAASFFFPAGATWTSLTEVRLKDKNGKVAGNVDIVLVAYDQRARVVDYGALEVQAVYISGNVRRPFEHYMEDPRARADLDWREQPNYPRPDYLSSSRKRLAPQLMFKGGILNSWRRKLAVALSRTFFETLPQIEEVAVGEADMAWLVYELRHDKSLNRYQLVKYKTVYSRFSEALDQMTKPDPGQEKEFLELLQTKLDEKLEDGNPPEVRTLEVDL
jgi:hypothetical protein